MNGRGGVGDAAITNANSDSKPTIIKIPRPKLSFDSGCTQVAEAAKSLGQFQMIDTAINPTSASATTNEKHVALSSNAVPNVPPAPEPPVDYWMENAARALSSEHK